MDTLADTNDDLSPKELKPFFPDLSSSEDEKQPSGSGGQQEPKTHPSPQTSTPSSGRSSSAPAYQQDVTADPNASRVAKVKRQALQDRVIHLLALKPYKFNHLVQKLQRDGLMAREHKALKSVLAEVAVLMNGNIVLKDRFFKDVDENWLGYRIEERQLLRRILMRRKIEDDWNQEKWKSSTADFPKPPKSGPPVSTVWKKPRISHMFKGIGKSALHPSQA